MEHVKRHSTLILALALVFALGALTALIVERKGPDGTFTPRAALAQQQQDPVWAWPVEKLKAHVEKVRASKDMTPTSWPGAW